MEAKRDFTSVQKTKENYEKSCLPNDTDVLSEWFSQEHPDRLNHLSWNRDHNQYHEYHKTL